MIESRMKNHIVNVSNYNTINLYCQKKNYKGMTHNVGVTVSVGDTTPEVTTSTY